MNRVNLDLADGKPKVYAAGIIGALWVYGLLQERIMSQPYDGEMFQDSVLLSWTVFGFVLERAMSGGYKATSFSQQNLQSECWHLMTCVQLSTCIDSGFWFFATDSSRFGALDFARHVAANSLEIKSGAVSICLADGCGALCAVCCGIGSDCLWSMSRARTGSWRPRSGDTWLCTLAAPIFASWVNDSNVAGTRQES